jgi:hypothetical protein
MLAMVATWLGTKLGRYLAICGAVLSAVFFAWAKGRSDGAAKAEANAHKAGVKAAEQRANAENRADRDPDPVERLRRDWSRK